MKRFKYSIVLGLVTSLILSLYITLTEDFSNDVLIVCAIFVFIMMTLMSYFKMFAHITNQEVKFQQLKNVAYSGRANHYKDGVTVGGNLYLTDNQLIFQTNMLNFIQKHETVIDIKSITETHFEKTLGIVNNGLSIITSNGMNERFVVTNREIWKNEIEKAIKSN